jgi:phosphodiesterase/alkaline phosphatase D-like protein
MRQPAGLAVSRIPVTVLALALFAATPAMAQLGGQQDRGGITHGPILGRPGATEMAVWARTARPGAFVVHYGTRMSEMNATSVPATARLEADNTGWVLLKGLKPETQYFYRVATPGASPLAGMSGSFRTLPAADDYRHPAHNPRGLFNVTFE